MVLDGSTRVDEILKTAMLWDVMGGVARRAWARNENALETGAAYNRIGEGNHITLPFLVEDEEALRALVKKEAERWQR